MTRCEVSTSPGSYAVGVVLAAGMGTRVGADGNKAYLRVAGRSMVSWSLDTLTRVPGVTRTVLVFRRGEHELARDTVNRELPSATVEFVEGGDSRHASEFNVLRHLAADIESGSIDVVLIHDAARPVAGPDMFLTALSTAREFGGAIPALPVVDAVRTGRDGGIEALTDAGPWSASRRRRRFAPRHCSRPIAPQHDKDSRAPTLPRVSRPSPMPRSARSAVNNATSR